jgi:hypothetical protein
MENILNTNDLVNQELKAAKLESDRFIEELNLENYQYLENLKKKIEMKNLKLEELQIKHTNQSEIIQTLENELKTYMDEIFLITTSQI